MKYNPHLCINCQSNPKAHKRTEFCEECFDKQIKTEIMNEDRVVESPHNSWF